MKEIEIIPDVVAEFSVTMRGVSYKICTSELVLTIEARDALPTDELALHYQYLKAYAEHQHYSHALVQVNVKHGKSGLYFYGY